MNYLSWPHLHFSGTYRADVSTVNNFPFLYDPENTVPADYLKSANPKDNWNPKGSGEWSVNGLVTHVCYADGHCVGEDEGEKDAEPIIGAEVMGKCAIDFVNNGLTYW